MLRTARGNIYINNNIYINSYEKYYNNNFINKLNECLIYVKSNVFYNF